MFPLMRKAGAVMNEVILYIHGKGGSAAESDHYRQLFPGRDIRGLDYQISVPWESGREIYGAAERLRKDHENIILIASSIGAYFSMNAGIGPMIGRACFISPIVDMERLIRDMMAWAHVTETQLKAQGLIRTAFGEDLSWEYLSYVRRHPLKWNVPTEILYGSRDHLTSYETVRAFAQAHKAGLTVMEGGEHWFHTEGQMDFLDGWIRSVLG